MSGRPPAAPAVFFDLDDTLLDERGAQDVYLGELYASWGADLPHDDVSFRAAWRQALARYFELQLRGEITQAEQRRARMREVFQRPRMSDAEADARIAEFVAVYEASWRLFDDVPGTLDALADRSLGVITNGTAVQQHAKLARTGILERFTVVVTSESAGAAKPLPAIFREACARIGRNPRGCVHVGDDVTRDVLGALGAGLRPVWLDLGRAPTMPGAAAACPAGVARVGSLSELPALLGAQGVVVGPGVVAGAAAGAGVAPGGAAGDSPTAVR